MPKLAHGRATHVQQILVGWLLFRQPGIGQLLQGPGGFPEFKQAHHARTALEGVKRTAQRGLFAQILRRLEQGCDGQRSGLHHFTGLVEKYLAHLSVFVVLRSRRAYGCGWQRRACNIKHRRIGCKHDWNVGNRCRLLRQHRHQLVLRLRLDVRRGGLVTPHHRTQFAKLLVVHEQLLGERTLVTQHVDQEAHCPQAVAELLEDALPGCGTFVNLVNQELLHTVAHTQCRQRSLVEPQHGEHAAHLRQLAGHLVQRHPIQRVAKKLVQRLLDLAQSAAQFVHHAAHGLVVTDAAVQLLHPGFHRLGRGAGGHVL